MLFSIVDVVPTFFFSGTVVTSLLFLAAAGSVVAYINPKSSTEQSKRAGEQKKIRTQNDVVVVGCGVAGAAFAYAMSKQGRQVTVIERDMSEPDRIVGELMQPGGIKALQELGLFDEIDWDGIDAIIEKGYTISYGDEKVQLFYPPDECSGEQLTGRSFHHGRFITELRKAVQRQPGVTVMEATATDLLRDESGRIIGVTAKNKLTSEKDSILAPLTLVADGCFSKFRKELTSSKVQVPSTFVGIVLHDCKLTAPGLAEVFLGDNCVLGYQIGTTDIRLLVDVPGEKLPSSSNGDLQKYMELIVAPQLPETIRPAFFHALNSQRIRSMPCSYLPSSISPQPGVILLGDAVNMRHPLTGGGMSVALKDVAIWSNLLHDIPFDDNNESDASIADAILVKHGAFCRIRMSEHSFVVNVLAQALYSLFSAADTNLNALRSACFDYFKLGGCAVSGPISLLAVLGPPRPHVLIGHFFAVAIYSVILSLRSNGIVSGLWPAAKQMWAAVHVISPLISRELYQLTPSWITK